MTKEKDEITVQQAYQAMLIFLEREYELTRSNDLGGLLGGYQLTSDGKTMDPASWDDWIAAIDQVLNGTKKNAI